MVGPALPESERVRAETQKLRLKAIGLRIQSADIFCNVAESELRWEPPHRTEEALLKIRRALAQIQQQIHEAQAFVPANIAKLENLVAEVEARAGNIEARLNQKRGKQDSEDPADDSSSAR